MEISDNVEHKYIDSVSINDYEVWTDEGWVDIKSINETVEYDVWDLLTENHQLKCADNHIVFNDSFGEVFVKDLKQGDIIKTEKGDERVLSVKKTYMKDNMYDLSLAKNSKHRFFTDGILSHNSTIYCIYALWLATFFQEKKIMLLANKAATALELLGRIEMGYEYLPYWIKSSCTVFNKGEITFGNMSSIRAFASSSDSARGFSANCIEGNTKIKIRLFKKDWLQFNIPIKWLSVFRFINRMNDIDTIQLIRQ